MIEYFCQIPSIPIIEPMTFLSLEVRWRFPANQCHELLEPLYGQLSASYGSTWATADNAQGMSG
jgi:hypothetical protein